MLRRSLAHRLLLRWCQAAGIEMATVYLLSTENLQRDPEELAALIEIITDVVEEICAPANRWSVRTVGDLELLGEEPARRERKAAELAPFIEAALARKVWMEPIADADIPVVPAAVKRAQTGGRL